MDGRERSVIGLSLFFYPITGGQMNWLLGGTLVGAVVGLWGQIRNIAAKMRSLFIIRVQLDGRMGEALCYYCWHHMRRMRLGDRDYGSSCFYIRPKRRREFFGYEVISRTGVIFWKGWRPLVVSRDNEVDGSSSVMSHSQRDSETNFFFLRWTFDLDELLLKSLELFNEHVRAGSGSIRFRIVHKMRQLTGGNGNADAPIETSSTVDQAFCWNRRILKWTVDDFGQEREDGDPFEFLFYPDKALSVVREVNYFLKRRQWYREHGVPWRRGWLLYGAPGTGKTRLIRAIGVKFDIPIFVFHLPTFDDRSFIEAWEETHLYSPCIAVFEDIDTVFNGRKNIVEVGMMEPKLSFDTLLGALDGVDARDGILTFITANHLENIDAAIANIVDGKPMPSRPGRID